jgi:hypothetical protein
LERRNLGCIAAIVSITSKPTHEKPQITTIAHTIDLQSVKAFSEKFRKNLVEKFGGFKNSA